MAYDQQKFDDSIEKIKKHVSDAVTKGQLDSAVEQRFATEATALRNQMEADKAELKDLVMRLADAIDGEDLETAQEVLDEIKTSTGIETNGSNAEPAPAA